MLLEKHQIPNSIMIFEIRGKGATLLQIFNIKLVLSLEVLSA